VTTSRNPTISLRLAGDPAARLTVLDRDEMWVTPEQEQLALPVSALGFWVALRSLPQSVEMREGALCSRLGMTRHTLHKLAQTLEDHGRLDREPERDDRGQFALSVWTIYVEPLPQDLRSRRVRKRAAGTIHAPDSPCTEKSYMEKKSSVVVVNKNKPTTTTTITAAASETVAADLIMPQPGLFDEAQQDTFRRMLTRSRRPAVEHQQLLDELVYAASEGGIRKPAGYLAGLIQRAQDGEYMPDGALIVARERNEATAAEAVKITAAREAAEQLARRADPAAQERVRAAAAAALASIGGLFAPRPSEAEDSKELDWDNPEIPPV
jgi:hypothetical protein